MLTVCLVGAGPRGLSVLERLCANERKSPAHRAVTVHVVEPREPGPGRVWRTRQSRRLLMNTVASQVTVYTDHSVMMDGPVVVSPYAAFGGGWKSYMWAFDPQGGPDARGFDLAWSYAAGAEARFGANKRFGLRAEYRDLRTPIERWGEDLTHQDRVLTAGLLVNF